MGEEPVDGGRDFRAPGSVRASLRAAVSEADGDLDQAEDRLEELLARWGERETLGSSAKRKLSSRIQIVQARCGTLRGRRAAALAALKSFDAPSGVNSREGAGRVELSEVEILFEQVERSKDFLQKIDREISRAVASIDRHRSYGKGVPLEKADALADLRRRRESLCRWYARSVAALEAYEAAEDQGALRSGPETRPAVGEGPGAPPAPAAPAVRPQGADSPERVLRTRYRKLVAEVEKAEPATHGARRPRTSETPVRNPRAREAVVLRSGGRCENPSCGGQPADVTDTGEAILDVDHVEDISAGGRDHPVNMVALCPNCHAVKTRGSTRETLRAVLRAVAEEAHRRAGEEAAALRA
ncbi:HNH endonuclease [Kitasatospora sp. NA04385]|uniref:HNH endonuclease signature motif containing protein n=1 Tax=Kitasatospora sp. NA04385 TaxID=2742135 RepID=UPI001592357B|nr:HNH endonuclease signature motif containing protein [Kitasatospora sp. NA04385]QKW22898.1 HNH endonuclease [Kitasatospora sp. NA04385]